MASWMVHLRVADSLLNQIPGLSQTEFIVGNIAPDSGIPNEDGITFTPSSVISHFKLDDGIPKTIHIPSFVDKYFTFNQQLSYSREECSFFLGYLSHLLTDLLWVESAVIPLQKRYPDQWAADKKALIREAKTDWYDLDFLYLINHPDFRAFSIYEKAVGFKNTCLDFFSSDAFDKRREYITAFYRSANENLDRPYPYFTEQDAQSFVLSASRTIRLLLQEKYCVRLHSSV